MIIDQARRLLNRLPLGMLGMLALVLATERSMARHALDLTSPEHLDWGEASLSASTIAPHCEILGFGDSLLRVGILPQVIEDRTDKRMQNLAVFAGQAPGSYFLFRQAVESGARPVAVIVDFKPSILAMTPRQFIDRWPGLLTVRDALDVAWTTRDASFFAATMLARHIPSIKNYYQIRQEIKAAFQGGYTHNRGTLLAMIRNSRRNRGAQPHIKNLGFHGQVNLNDEVLFSHNWSYLPVHATYMRRFFDLAAKHNIRVFWLLPPVAPASEARQVELGLDAAYTRLVRETQQQYPNIVVIDGRRADYDATTFVDPTHLNRDGAITLSLHVGAIVAAHLKHDVKQFCWVDLPPYVEQAIDIPIEDFEQSLLAIKNQFGRRQ